MRANTLSLSLSLQLYSLLFSFTHSLSLSLLFTLHSLSLHSCSSSLHSSMAINRDSTPPPMIGKIGPYTVFMTPPSTPSPKPFQQPVFDSPKKIVVPPPPPPVQPPPQQFAKSLQSSNSNDSVVGFFKNAVTKVQNGMWVFPVLAQFLWISFMILWFLGEMRRNMKNPVAKMCALCSFVNGKNI